MYEADLDWDIPLVPHLAQASTRLKQRHSDRQQAGAHSHRAALPPLLSYGLDPDDHFYQTRVRAQQPLPTEQLPVLDMDLRFAASLHAHHRGRLRSLRDSALGALRELKRRWTSVTKHLRQFQPPSIQAVTSKRDLGLVSLLVVLTSWADTGYPYGLIQGLPAVGYLEDPLFTKKGAEGQIEHLDVEKGFGRGNLFVFCPSLSARKTPRVSKLSNMHGLLSDAESVQAQNHCGHFGYNCPVLQGQP